MCKYKKRNRSNSHADWQDWLCFDVRIAFHPTKHAQYELFLSTLYVSVCVIWLSNISLWFEYWCCCCCCFGEFPRFVHWLSQNAADEYLNPRLTKESKIKHFNQLFIYSMNQTHATTESATAHWFYADFPGLCFFKKKSFIILHLIIPL